MIFMELCSEGTLESLVEMSGGLHEGLTRRYTAQMLSAVAELHRHGVVHRDIKPANIFLTKAGHCLKLGDFGSAVKIQEHTTVAGELQGYVGTQSYMAPEVIFTKIHCFQIALTDLFLSTLQVFTKNNTVGHGRAADIWSVGCVVIEMASGKVNPHTHHFYINQINIIILHYCLFHSGHGVNSIRISKLCSKWAWANHQIFLIRCRTRDRNSLSIVCNTIPRTDGWRPTCCNITFAKSV